MQAERLLDDKVGEVVRDRKCVSHPLQAMTDAVVARDDGFVPASIERVIVSFMGADSAKGDAGYDR